MSWLSDIVSGDGEDEETTVEPAERILQLRRGISAAASALPEERAETAREAVEAADRLADRVAELVETPGPGEDAELETPDLEVDAAGWLREGPARRREAGGPAGAEVAHAGPLPSEVAREGAGLLDDLHFSLLRMEILGVDPDALSVADTIEEVRALAGRLPDPDEASAGGGEGASAGAGAGGADGGGGA